jgi:hypothetical protein
MRGIRVVAVDREPKEWREKPNEAKLALLRQAVTDNPYERTKRFDLLATFLTRSARADAPQAYTALSDVHACEPLEGGNVLVGTTGELALVGAQGTPLHVWTVLDGLPETRVHALFADGSSMWGERHARGDRLWVATARGLTSLPTSTGSPAQSFGGSGVLPSCVVHAVAPLSGGGALVGTEKRAAVVKEGAVTLIDEKKSVPVRAVWAVGEGADGLLLIGTSAGLYAGKIGRSWQRASMASGQLRDDWVTALTVRGASVVVGTYNGGVTRLEWTAAHAFVLGEHLGGGYVSTAGMLVDAQTIYVATMDGLLARPLKKDAAWRLVTNAAPGRDVTGVLASTDGVWISSRRGILHRPTL